MLFTSTIVLAFSALTSIAVAQGIPGSENPITNPLGGAIEAGSAITITWTRTFGDSCDLVLRSGEETDLDEVQTIATGIPNNAAFTWSVPGTIAAGDDYSIEISCGGEINYSPPFTINSDVRSTSSSSRSSTSTSTLASTSTSTSTSSAITATTTASVTTSSSGFTNSTTTMRTSTSVTPTSSPTSAPDDEAANINAGVHLASPLALVLCIFAGLLYLN